MGSVLLLGILLLLGTTCLPAQGNPAKMRAAVYKCDPDRCWEELKALYRSHSLDIGAELDLLLNPYTVPISDYDPVRDRVTVSEMPAPDSARAYWDNWSTLLTAGNWELADEFASAKEMRRTANFANMLIMAHELGHYVDLRYPKGPPARGMYEYRANRIAMAVARHYAQNKALNHLLQKYLQFARTYLAIHPASTTLKMGPDDHPDSLAVQHHVNFTPVTLEEIQLYVAYQFALQDHIYAADADLTLAEVLRDLQLPDEGYLICHSIPLGNPFMHGQSAKVDTRPSKFARLDAGTPTESYYAPPCAPNQPPVPQHAKCLLYQDAAWMTLEVKHIGEADRPAGEQRTLLRLSRAQGMRAVQPLGDFPLEPGMADTSTRIQDFTWLADTKLLALLRTGPAATPKYTLAILDFSDFSVQFTMDMAEAARIDPFWSDCTNLKFVTSQSEGLWVLRIQPTPEGGTDFALYTSGPKIKAEDVFRMTQVQRFSAQPGHRWFGAVDYLVDDQDQVWISDPTRGRILAVDKGNIHVAAGQLRGYTEGDCMGARLFQPGSLGFDRAGNILVADLHKTPQLFGIYTLNPMLRKLNIRFSITD